MLAVMARLNMVFMGFLLKELQKCRLTAKTVYKYVQMVKSYGQNRFVTKMVAISLVFLTDFELILSYLEGPLNLLGFERNYFWCSFQYSRMG
jgi:hypothetical protein